MASEIRVNKIENRSGLGTVTFADTGVDLAGITTAATLKATTGIVTSLSANEFGIGTDSPSTELEIQAATDPKIRLQSQESGNKRLELYVDGGAAVGTIAADQSASQLAFRTSGAERLRIEAAGNLKSNHNLSVTGIATVGSAVTISESGIEASGIGITIANINGGQISGRRNIIINGAMNIAQRIGGQTSTTTTSGFTGLDRWSNPYSHDATMTFSQHQLTSSDSGPYEEGFRYSHHATNGSTSADAGQYYNPQQPIEAQNISTSGWNYKSSTSYITLSFWVKSSVGQEFHGSLMTIDGTIYKYPFSFTVSADTWTKVVKTIPGNSNLQIDNNNGEGARVTISPYMGTNYTSSGVTNDTWSTWSTSARFKDFTSTWWTTNGATFEFTGVQLEPGPQATPFEFLSFGEEMTLCQRYYYQNTSYGTVCANDSGETINTAGFLGIVMYSSTSGRHHL